MRDRKTHTEERREVFISQKKKFNNTEKVAGANGIECWKVKEIRCLNSINFFIESTQKTL